LFRIAAEYSEQFEVRASIERAREFFNEPRHFVELMPGVESITAGARGVMRWLIRAEVPVLGAIRQSFSVVKTEDNQERIEWTPADDERQNFLRYAATFEPLDAARTLVKVVQKVELRRKNGKELHMLASFVGESRISKEMQKGVTDMMRAFLTSARARLESASV